MRKRKFAVFDIDGTLYRGSFYLDVVEALIDNKSFSMDYKSQTAKTKAEWHNRSHHLAYRTYIDDLIAIFQKHAHELEASTLEKVARDITKNKKGYVYAYTRGLAKELKAKDYFLIALSGSFHEVVEPFAKHHGFDLIFGEETVRKNGKLTNQRKMTTFRDKDLLIKRMIEENNLTLSGNWAIGDSMNDASMLAMVDHPVAFNPEIQLLEEARKQGWKVVVERKNVVYELEERDGSYLLAEAKPR